MASNSFKCNHLTLLHFEGLTILYMYSAHRFGLSVFAVNIVVKMLVVNLYICKS